MTRTGTPKCWKWAVLGPDKDPEFMAKSNAVLRLAREVWLSSAATTWSRAHTGVVNPRELNTLVQLINDHDGDNQPHESIFVNWIINSLGYFGIKITNPVQWSIEGETFDATISTKHNFKTMLIKAWDRSLKTEIAKHDNEVTQSLDLASIRGYVRKMSTSHRTIYTQAVAGTTYTYQRANKVGAKVEAKCPLGCSSPDTMLYRLVEYKKKPHRLEVPKGITIGDILRPTIKDGTEL